MVVFIRTRICLRVLILAIPDLADRVNKAIGRVVSKVELVVLAS